MIRNETIRRMYYCCMSALCFGVWLLAGILSAEARYKTETGGSAGARVARFLVNVEDPVLLSGDGILDCNEENDSVVYSIFVENLSEVDVCYQATVSGYGESVRCDLAGGSGRLSANGGRAEIRAAFTLIDPDSKTQPERLSSIAAHFALSQAEEEGS